jgi:hypothetical protein
LARTSNTLESPAVRKDNSKSSKIGELKSLVKVNHYLANLHALLQAAGKGHFSLTRVSATIDAKSRLKKDYLHHLRVHERTGISSSENKNVNRIHLGIN